MTSGNSLAASDLNDTSACLLACLFSPNSSKLPSTPSSLAESYQASELLITFSQDVDLYPRVWYMHSFGESSSISGVDFLEPYREIAGMGGERSDKEESERG